MGLPPEFISSADGSGSGVRRLQYDHFRTCERLFPIINYRSANDLAATSRDYPSEQLVLLSEQLELLSERDEKIECD